ncbi:MAG: hypothetical protein IJV31_00995 [Clostridia bacterium]|nr:hypothetical protein [Clostridia bacterium]MBQ9657327.1 hypothetical protein [Clostridia bacterium]
MLDNEETNGGINLSDVVDDSSWKIFEDVENLEEWLGIDYSNSDTPRIIEKLNFE